MKKTLPLLLVVAGLGVATLFVGDEPAPPAAEPLRLAGYATDAQLNARKGQSVLAATADIAYPVDGIEITRGETTIQLARDAEAEPPAWRLRAPVEAVAVTYQVEKMVRLFETPTASVYAKRIAPEDLPLFDLEPERRIEVTLTRGDDLWNDVRLRIGKVTSSDLATADGGVVQDTWVQRSDRVDVVYRVGGKDLRGPFETTVDALRDKRLFIGGSDSIRRISVTAPDGREVQAEVATDGADDGGWRITAPAEGPADRAAQSLASSLTSTRARRFVRLDAGPPAGLGENPWRLAATTQTGDTLALHIAAAGDDEVWARVPDRQEWALLEARTAAKLQKTWEDLRDKTLLTLEADAVEAVTFSPPDATAYTVQRRKGRWAFADGHAAEVDAPLKAILGASAQRYARPDELQSARAALRSPDVTAQVRARTGRYTIVFGPVMEEAQAPPARWAQVRGPRGGTEDIVLVADNVAQRFRKTQAETAWKRVFDLAGATLDRLEVQWPDGESSFTLIRGPDGLDPSPMPEGKRPARMALGSMERTFGSLRAKNFTSDRASTVGLSPSDAYRFTGRLSDGRTLELRVSRQTAGSDPYAATGAGPLAGRVFTVSQFQALNLQKRIDELVE